MDLEEIRQKPDDFKRKILIVVIIILVLILGTWWFMNTKHHFEKIEEKGIEINLPSLE